jgi:hypothetical protein
MIPANVSPVANHLWQSTLFAAAAWLLTLALRKNHAGVRYRVWLAASIKFLIPFWRKCARRFFLVSFGDDASRTRINCYGPVSATAAAIVSAWTANPTKRTLDRSSFPFGCGSAPPDCC